MLGGRLEHGVFGINRLYDDLSRYLSPAGSSRYLGDHLECFFVGAEIGQIEVRIGHEDTDQRNAGKIVSLGDHLRANHNVHFTLGNGVENPLQIRSRS